MKNKMKIFLLALTETAYLLAPIMICIVVLLAYGQRTIEGKSVSIFTLSEWSFLSSFLFVSVLRDKLRTLLSTGKVELYSHIRVFVLGTLAIFSASLLGILYAYNTNLIENPKHVEVFGQMQIILIIAALLLHLEAKYMEYACILKEAEKKESQ